MQRDDFNIDPNGDLVNKAQSYSDKAVANAREKGWGTTEKPKVLSILSH